MDGRMFRKWCALGCLLAAGAGCNRAARQQTLIGPGPGDGAKLVNMPVGGGSKSLWGGSKSGPSLPVEMVSENSKKPASAAALVAIADVQLEAAFEERTAPGSKEALLDAARKGYQKALQQEPKSKEAVRGLARFYAKLGEREKAIDTYKKYLTIYPKDAEVAHEVAVAHARWKDWPGAVAWCEFTLKIDPENRTAKKTMGFCQAMAGNWDGAFGTLSQIMPEAQARHNIAGLLDQTGRTDAARAQLQMALKVDPNYAPSAEFLAELSRPREANTPNPNAVQTAGAVQPAP
jgi:tetratricopeptide (TPR) repeat protein